jgi:hypothetical protein
MLPAVLGLGRVRWRTAKRWDGATCQMCAPLSYCDVSNSTKRSDVAGADNGTKWIRPFVRQIFFRKECARVDSRARSSACTAQYRPKLSFLCYRVMSCVFIVTRHECGLRNSCDFDRCRLGVRGVGISGRKF